MKKYLLLMLLFLAVLPVASQEERIDTVIPKFLINGYFFREMPKLPDSEQTFSGLKDKEGNRLLAKHDADDAGTDTGESQGRRHVLLTQGW